MDTVVYLVNLLSQLSVVHRGKGLTLASCSNLETAPHTGIGFLAKAIETLEDHVPGPELSRKNPTLSSYQCFAETGKLPRKWTRLVRAAAKCDHALKRFAQAMVKESRFQRAMVATTRAVDIVRGGVKVS